MRKLLVASQKGGVGKTTTSVNLAAGAALAGARVLLVDTDPLSNVSSALGLADHPQRRLLAEEEAGLPGMLVSNVVPGLDVLSPYDGGGCSDDDLSYLLALLATPAVRECYSCLIVDTPPFLGANPNQLLHTCDQFLVVMRAEALAHRTLPALLELAQRSKTQNHSINFRGILLTLPEGEDAGRWERELRGRLGTRVLPQVVPFDDAVTQAALERKPVVHDSRGPAALAYLSLVEALELASGARETVERTSAAAALLSAAASLKRGATARRPAEQPAPHAPEVVVPEPAPRPARPALPRPPAQPAYTEADFKPMEEPKPAPPPAPVQAAAPPPPAPASPPPPQNVSPLSGLAWVAAAIAVGLLLRFVPLDQSALPVLVGVGVGSVVVFLLGAMSAPQQQAQQNQPAAPPAPSAPPPAPAEQRPAAARRLSGLKRRLSPRRGS